MPINPFNPQGVEANMANNTERWIGYWSGVRERGVWRFVWLQGVLLFGLPINALTYLLSDRTYLDGSAYGVFRFLTIATISGLVCGSLMWWMNERRYRKNLGSNA